MRSIRERFDATIVGIPPMGDFYICGASVKLFLPILKMNFPEIVNNALREDVSADTKRRFFRGFHDVTY